MSKTPSSTASLDLTPQLRSPGEPHDDSWVVPRPSCRYVLRYVPMARETRHERRLFEWCLEWATTADVTDVTVHREPDADPPNVRIEIDTILDCEEVERIDGYDDLLEALDEFGERTEETCRSIDDDQQW